jgi:hypothetical protein
MSRYPLRPLTLIGILTVAVIAVVPLSLAPRAVDRPIAVSVIVGHAGPTGVPIALDARSFVGAVQLGAAIVPGTSPAVSNRTLFVLSDPGFQPKYCGPSDVAAMVSSLSSDLSELHSPVDVRTVDAESLPAVLTNHPGSVLLDLCYDFLPDSVFSNNSSLLLSWLRAGGSLFWAGGPLAYYEGHLAPSGAVIYDSLNWQGQLKLAGFPLEDPIGSPEIRSVGPLVSTGATAWSSALGLTYEGTADGANVTQVAKHGGVALGYVSAPAAGPPSPDPRTSLAFVAVGSGGIYYFGGALWGTGSGVVPSGTVALSTDIALLIAVDYVPVPGNPLFQNLSLASFGSGQASFLVPISSTPGLIMVRSEVSGVFLFLWDVHLPQQT